MTNASSATTTNTSKTGGERPSRVIELFGNHSTFIGFILRIFLAWFLPWLLDDGRIIPEVQYTDIDYTIFTDAAQYVEMGQSPYDRHTYRYTPFLAQLLAYFMPWSREVGRYIFCFADSICGWIIIKFRQRSRASAGKTSTTEALLVDAILWNYNPLAINICTRGSAESLMVLLPVLLTLWIVVSGNEALRDDGQEEEDESQANTTDSTNSGRVSDGAILGQALIGGICHGIAIHSKLYPIIYTLSYMAYFAVDQTMASNISGKNHTFPWLEPKKLLRLIVLWIQRLFRPIPLLFLITSLLTFAGLTYLAMYYYGETALQEGLLYHFSRVDHRHNYSMYWYWIYLARAKTTAVGATNLKMMGRLLLLPQFVLLVYSSLGIAPYDLGLALFIQTYLFVIHNKVITAQYFTWYLCLLPICSNSFDFGNKRVKVSTALLLLSIGFWLGSAYCLEMQGMDVHKLVWVASVLYFFANVNMMGALLRSSSDLKQRQHRSGNNTKKDQ